VGGLLRAGLLGGGAVFLTAMGAVVVASLAVSGVVVGATTTASAPSASGASAYGHDQEVGTASAVPGVPTAYLVDAERSAARFDVPWSVLLGIYRVECDFGTSRLPGCNPAGTENPDGAQGPGQFLAPTWRTALHPMERIPLGPPTSSDADGFATDGDGDGVADPWDPADAIASTARMLAADGASTDLAGAVFDYNHSSAYVEQVLGLAAGYRQLASRSGPATSAAAVVVAFARAQLGKPYRYAGAGPGVWDCSGLTMVAYEAVGLWLPHNAEAQYQATAAATVSLGGLQPGDLIYFGPDLTAIGHVGIYVGGGDMIDAPHTGAFVRVESIRWSDLLVATRPLAVPTGD
jgi:cell wall-associated NlpC family hydrolase